ncbi:MAG TPA: sortase [Chloroflexi bacterium]|nr:sortase [Chloroflexota bacterium]
MKDRRSVDDLSIEELEEILRVRKREARLERVRQLGKDIESNLDPLASKPVMPSPPPLSSDHRQYQALGATAHYRSYSIDDADSREQREIRPIRWDWVRDKSLLVVEIVLILGLLFVLFDALTTVRQINTESSAAQRAQIPTSPAPTATPVIRVALLPGGHTPPDSPGGPAPEEIPAHLRDLVDAITPLPMPTPGPEQAIRIQIPTIGVDAPVLEGDDWETLKEGAGHYVGSVNPGERGNCVISAHNDIFGEIFRDLPELDLGDEIFVHTQRQVYRYVVTQKRIVKPTEVSVMDPTSQPVLTLISCYPYGINTHRIVVIAELKPN